MITDSAIQALLTPIRSFLHGDTPDAWILMASQPENLNIILRDHLMCEQKA